MMTLSSGAAMGYMAATVLFQALYVSAGILLLFLVYHTTVLQNYYAWRVRMQSKRFRGSTFKPLIGDLGYLSIARQSSGGRPFYDLFQWWDRNCGRVCYLWFGPEFRLRVGDPAAAKAILVTEAHCFHKPGLMRRTLGLLLGEGLLLSEDAVHGRHRRMINPAFHFGALKSMGPLMVDSTIRCISKWSTAWGQHGQGGEDDHDEEDGEEAKGGSGNEREDVETWSIVDMHEELSGLTLDIISRAAFGFTPDSGTGGTDSTAIVYHALDMLLKSMASSVGSGIAFIPGFIYIPTPGNIAARNQIASMRALLKGVIAQRRAARARGEVKEGEILLDHLLDARDSTAADTASQGTRLSDEEILNECLTFITAGHETTANALSWTVLLLDQNPLVRDSAYAEVLSVLGTSRPPTVEDLPSMPFLGWILQESMRLYPPAPIVARQAICDVTVPLCPNATLPDRTGAPSPATLTIPAGANLTIPIYSMHRDPDLWPGSDPGTFDPTRWKNGVAGACTHPAAYIPFSTGPRNCIGQTFAMQEAKMILAILLQRVEWKIASYYEHAPAIMVTLRPGKGMPVMLRARS